MKKTKQITKTTLKECCVACGFPIDMERKPVILDNNQLSYLLYEDERCTLCGHQKSGWTIPVVYEHIQKLMKDKIAKQKVRDAIEKLKITLTNNSGCECMKMTDKYAGIVDLVLKELNLGDEE